jgi:hypothetical protein
MSVERVELLAGKSCDAFWVNWGGEPLRAAGIEKRIRWWSAKKFGPEGAFGPHRFRYGIATVAPVADPTAPANGAIVLGITPGTFADAYDKGNREVVAQAYIETLEAERELTRGFAERLFEARFGTATVRKPSPQEDAPRMNVRVAIYARYSSENQREASIEDQVRVCRGARRA